MYKKIILFLILSIGLGAPAIAEKGPDPALALTTTLDWNQVENPDGLHWPGPFWLWNGPLDPAVLKTQLEDMNAHGFKSVCVLPMPHSFRPDSTNNEMDPDYLTPEYQDRIRYAAGIAADLGMNWWIYDEGGWPSGQALGKVAEGRPELQKLSLVREEIPGNAPYTVPEDALALTTSLPSPRALHPGEIWTPSSPADTAVLYRIKKNGYVDLMNPEVTRRFIALTHDAYAASIGNLFGRSVHFTFTDEPNCPNLHPPADITWTRDMDKIWMDRFGAPIIDALPALFTPPDTAMDKAIAETRIRFYDLWTNRFREAYFLPLRDWARTRGLASGGHLNGEDETANAVRHGFGHVLRQLRALDVPGVDVIWRQLFPGKENPHFFPKYAATAAHQNGTRYAVTESFCVYGNGLTPAQMKWVVDYQYVRGLNLLVVGCFPLSTQAHHMTGERPHFGPSDPLWDALPAVNAYVACLGYLMSAGAPDIHTALYYPVRDLWAWGEKAEAAIATHDALAGALFNAQCDFDLIDDDLLADPASTIQEGFLKAGAMRYHTLVIGDTCWMAPESIEKLRHFIAAGGRVICMNHFPGDTGKPGDELSGAVITTAPDAITPYLTPTAVLSPASSALRVAARTTSEGKILFAVNETDHPYHGSIKVDTPWVWRIDPQTGKSTALPSVQGFLPIDMIGGASLVVWIPKEVLDTAVAKEMAPEATPWLLDAYITARPNRQWTVGEHTFEVATPPAAEKEVPFDTAKHWKNWLDETYSGTVDYTINLSLPDAWANIPLRLETGTIEYAAEIFVDDQKAGAILWAPWQIDLPPLAPGSHRITLRVANTLANELTSPRVAQAWAEKTGPGWPSPYHKRTLAFEEETKGGGLEGPVTLTRLKGSE